MASDEIIRQRMERGQASGRRDSTADAGVDFHTLAETIGAATFVFQGTELRYVNAAAEAITGYRRDELLRMSFWDVVHPDFRGLVKDRGLARQRGESMPPSYEVKLLTKEGEERWVAFTGASIELNGETAVLGTAFDITQTKAAQEAIRESEERLRLAAGIAKMATWDWDLRTGQIDWSAHHFESRGIIPKSFSGRLDQGLVDLAHPEDRERVREAILLAAREGRPCELEFRLGPTDNGVPWVALRAHTYCDESGRAVRVIGVAQDITSRKRVEVALRASEERYRDLVETLNDVIFEVDLQGVITYISPVIQVLSDYTVAEVSGQSFARFVHPEDLAALAESFRRTAQGHLEPSEFRVCTKDGGERWVRSYSKRVVREGGAIGVRGVLTDITDHKRTEDAARRHQAELAHVLRLSTMGEMAAVFAHEVNQPLSAIVGYAKGCERHLRAGSGDREEIIGAIREVAAQAVRAGAIIRRLRGFVRKAESRRESLHINDLVHEATHFARLDADRRRVDVHLDLARELPAVFVDAVQIEQVILNLIRNGLEAMLGTTHPPFLLSVQTSRRDKDVCVAVKDSGQGIPPAMAEKVFEPFVSTKAGGLGMGLSVCRSIVEAHGGRLWIAATEGPGATLCFSLPCRGSA